MFTEEENPYVREVRERLVNTSLNPSSGISNARRHRIRHPDDAQIVAEEREEEERRAIRRMQRAQQKRNLNREGGNRNLPLHMHS